MVQLVRAWPVGESGAAVEQAALGSLQALSRTFSNQLSIARRCLMLGILHIAV